MQERIIKVPKYIKYVIIKNGCAMCMYLGTYLVFLVDVF